MKFCFCGFSLINEVDFSNSWQSFFGNLNLLNRFFASKLNIYIIENEKKDVKNYFYININQ